MSNIYDKCPYITTQRVLQGKWAILILYHLSTGTKRFNELEKLMINRKVFPEVPPHVEYSLSKVGAKFQRVLDEIEVFGLDYIAELEKLE